MIAEVMRECHRYFPRTYENISLTFDATGKTITGDFGETYLVGQYICIQYSILNDGVYTVTAFDSETGVITVSETLRNETTTVNIFGLAPPRDFLDLVTEIDNFTGQDGVKSESIDDYSVSYEGDGSWKSVFRKRLDTYRTMFGDLGALVYGNNSLLYNDRLTY
jgi:hypothetical protein